MATFSFRTLVGAVIALGVAAACRPALALVVSDPSPVAAINTTAPADDPGWNNALTGFSGIYLGNQWVLTANHLVGATNKPTVATLPGGSYRIIPNSFRTLSNPGSFGGISLTANSDLLMFRIDTETNTNLKPEQQNPSVKPISVGSTQPGIGAELLMIGNGFTRTTNGADPINYEHHWNDSWTLTDPNSATKHGYALSQVTGANSWGKNRVADDAVIQDGSADGNNIVVQLPGGTLLITLATQWDRARNNSGAAIPGSTAVQYEAQAAPGDSGGAVFTKNGANWELVGVMAAIFLDGGQSAGGQTVYGNRTVFSDLTNSHYRSQIENLRPSTQYSIAGDVNLDGVVTGAVVNGAPTGDLAAFVAGWNNQQGAADIYSWKKGDLNGDGKTDFADFAILRGQLGGSVTAAQLSSLVAFTSPAANAVPEPNSIAIAAGAGIAWWSLRQRKKQHRVSLAM